MLALFSPNGLQQAPFAYWRICRSLIVVPHICELSNESIEARISDLGLELREVWNQSDRLPTEGRLDSSVKTSILRRFILLPALPLFAFMALLRTLNCERYALKQ
jgi:hypothetical protein